MTKCFILCLIIIFTFGPASAQTIWDGPKITFTKANNADHTLEENQDRITDMVWITRAATQGIFNIRTESSYTKNSSPADTEWAFGTTAELPVLVFENWQAAIDSNPPEMVGRDMVLHLITEDIYIGLKFLSWSVGTAGGGFSYERSTSLPSGAVDREALSGSAFVFPNPAAVGMVRAKFESDSHEAVNVSALGLNGKWHYGQILPAQPGINEWSLDLSTLQAGVYLILFRQGPRQLTRKIILE